MGSPKNRVCIWTPYDIDEHARWGRFPLCQDHEHVQLDEAVELTSALSSFLFVETDPNNKDRKIYHFEYEWVSHPNIPTIIREERVGRRLVTKVYSSVITSGTPMTWAIRKSGGVMEVHQLVHAGR